MQRNLEGEKNKHAASIRHTLSCVRRRKGRERVKGVGRERRKKNPNRKKGGGWRKKGQGGCVEDSLILAPKKGGSSNQHITRKEN